MRTRIELAPTDKVDEFYREVEEILVALGHPEALVTDESTIGDFSLTAEEQIAVERYLGVYINPHDRLWQIANNLRSKG